ncbi:hypothetical protein DHEL01_v203754 [Diaporthe helianthi]|uniref:Uncharacterized protein n=1 Tax=Diaporthe helianthi TaxID=158607 RepID=A0A2P5I5Q8_DIAHE|nr:hypothetical protein DHEL01_v203754 [Diaporthe helianthi]
MIDLQPPLPFPSALPCRSCPALPPLPCPAPPLLPLELATHNSQLAIDNSDLGPSSRAVPGSQKWATALKVHPPPRTAIAIAIAIASVSVSVSVSVSAARRQRHL